MAEDEIRKHTKAALKIMNDTEAGWKHKLKDILTEVLIIIFAVTVSIWFHNWSDKMEEHNQEKIFLAGFRTDLAGDIVSIQSNLDFYENAFKGMQYFAKVGTGDSLSNDSLKKYSTMFFSTTNLEAHASRYEALKSSGKLGIIEDADLLNKIIDLNESTLTDIQMLNVTYAHFVDKTSGYIQQNAQLDKPGGITNSETILRTSQWRFLMTLGQSTLLQNVIPVHAEGLKKCKALIQEIDKEKH